MASGNFTHFRHSVFAGKDEKVKEFSRLLGRKGKEAYFYYFTIIEHCSSISEDKQTTFKIHNETLRSIWESNSKGVQTMCKLLTSSALLVCKPCANHVIFEIPNLPKYLGSYDTKKRKEKEIKESNIQMRDQVFIESLKNEQAEEDAKKNLPNVQAIDFRNPKDFKFAGIKNPDELIQYWNTDFVLKGYPASPLTLGGGYQQNFFLINSRLLKEGKTWRDYLARVDRSSFLTVLKKGGKPSITWLLVEKNFDEIMSGKYDDAPEKEDPLDVFMAEFAPKREQA